MNDSERTLRPLFWAIIRLCFSFWITFGGLRIDLLPAFYGYYQVGRVVAAFPEYRPSRVLMPCLWVGAALSALDWMPGLLQRAPAWADTLTMFGGAVCQMVVFFHIVGLLICLSERVGRRDLAENGRRFRTVLLIPYVLLTLFNVYQGGVRNVWYMFLLIFEMGVAVYAANCDRALFPPKEGPQTESPD